MNIMYAIDSKSAYRVTLEKCNNFHEVIAEKFASPPGVIFKFSKDSCVHMDSNGFTYFSKRIRRIKISTVYTVNDDVMTPTFTSGLKTSHWFDLDDDFELLYINKYDLNTSSYSLVLVYDGCFYLPPLPNVHDDSLLCTGSIDVGFDPELHDLVAREQMFDNWMENDWNSDLLTDTITEQAPLFFRMDIEGNQLSSIGDPSDLDEAAPSIGDSTVSAIWSALC